MDTDPTDRIRGHGEAAEGRVRAEVDVCGALTELYIAESLAGFAMDDVATLVTQAQLEACSQARACADEVQRKAAVGTETGDAKRPAPATGEDEDPVLPDDWQDEWERAQWAP